MPAELCLNSLSSLVPLTREEDDAWEEADEAVTGDEKMRCSSRRRRNRVIARGERRLRHELMTRPRLPAKDGAAFRGGNMHFWFSIQATEQSIEID